MHMAMAVTTSNLVKQFKEIRAVDGISLNVPEGSIYGFLGPNGAGKTTTLKMLIGMTEPTSGSIEIFGEPVELGSLLKRSDIGFLPDVPGFYDWMTPEEFLKFCGKLYHIEQNLLNTRIQEILDLVGLKKSRKRKIGTFSRGMKQRMGIAQALINDPKIIFLDEPVSALDPLGRKEVMDIIAKLAGKVTVFFSTHILADVERVCDRVVIIHQGKVVLEDTIDNIKSQATHRQIEIEIEQGELSVLADQLMNEEWLDEAQLNGNTCLFTVHDLDKARIQILKLIVEYGITLKRMVVVEPTLEDVFIKVVNGGA
jgi:ABC-2 type transport system ATP-binding protein